MGGPIIRDKLWYFFSDETHIIGRTRTADPEGLLGDRLPYSKFFHKGTLKVTWQMTARNKLSSLTNLGFPITEDNMRPELGVTQEAQRFRWAGACSPASSGSPCCRTTWCCAPRPASARSSATSIPGAARTTAEGCDHIPSVTNLFPRQFWTGNDNQHTRDDLFSFQTLTALDWYPQRRLLGEHSLTLKHRYYTETNTRLPLGAG